MPQCRRLPQVFLSIALAATITQSLGFQQKVNPGNPSTIEDFKAGDANREPYSKGTGSSGGIGGVAGRLGGRCRRGSRVLLDAALRDGWPNGKVFAEDISNSAMGWLNARVRAFNLGNVEVVKGESNDPKLPTDRLAAVLAIADYSFMEHRSRPRADQLKLHEIDPALVREEVATAGFVVSKVQHPFVKWAPGVGNTRASATDLWLMVAVRPK